MMKFMKIWILGIGVILFILNTNSLFGMRWLEITDTPENEWYTDSLEANNFFKKSLTLVGAGNIESAIDTFYKATDLFEAISLKYDDEKLKIRLLTIYDQFSRELALQGKWTQVKKVSASGLRKAKAIEFSSQLIVVELYYWYGTSFLLLGPIDSADVNLSLGIDLHNSLTNKPGETISNLYNHRGFAYRAQREYEKAAEQHTKSLNILNSLDDPPFENFASNYVNIGGTYILAGEYSKALENFELAIEYCHKTEKTDFYNLAQAYNNMSTIYKKYGDFAMAENLSFNAIQLYLNHKDNRFSEIHLAAAYNNLSMAFSGQKKFPEALEYAKKAEKIRLSLTTDQRPNLASLYTNMGHIYLNLKEYETALAIQRKALAIRENIFGKDNLQTAYNIFNIGDIFLSTGENLEEALALSNKVLKIREEKLPEKHEEISTAYFNIGRIYFERKLFDKALEAFHQSAFRLSHAQYSTDKLLVPPTDSLINTRNMASILNWKGKTMRELFHLNQDLNYLLASLKHYDVASQLTTKLMRNFHSDSKGTLQNVSWFIYEGGMETSYHLYQQTKEKIYLEKALYFAEQSKAVLLSEGIRSTKALKFANIPEDVQIRERALRIDIAANEQEAADEMTKGERTDIRKIAKLREIIYAKQSEHDALIEDLEKDYPNYFAFKYGSQTASLGKIQQHLGPSSTLVEYLVGDKSTYVISINNNDIYLQKIQISRDSLNAKTNSLVKLLAASNANQIELQQATYEMFHLLLAPALADFDTDQLIIVPDGPLNALPFEVLQKCESKNQGCSPLSSLVLANYSVRYEYTASLFASQRSENQSDAHLLAMAPDYPPHMETSIHEIVYQNRPAISERRSSTNEYTRGRFFDPLIFNKTETERIAEIFDGHYYEKEAATKSHFMEHAPHAGILHLAMHAYADDEHPLESGLAFSIPQNIENIIFLDSTEFLSDSSQRAKAFDDARLLRVHELYNMEFNAQMAVLSACETGKGVYQRGEGAISLGRAFKYAGCPNIVMSLWKVSDQSTVELMEKFYKYLKEGMAKDKALQRAKLDYLAQHPEANPYKWAAFVLIGDDQPLSLGNGWMQYAIGIVLVLLFMGILWRWRAGRNQSRSTIQTS